MKKIFFILGALALTFGASAQLRVIGNGQVQVGNWNPSQWEISPTEPGHPFSVVSPGFQISIPIDSTTTVSVLGPNTTNLSGGSIAFGGRKDVMVEEESFNKSLAVPYGALALTGKGGIKYSSDRGPIFSYTRNSVQSSKETFTFNINVQAPAFLTTSDARYKKNVEPLESLGTMIGDLTPVSYNLDLSAGSDDSSAQKASSANSVSDRRSFGFLAQEVREIFPELVYEDENGMLSVDYNGFIPLLVDAYKELSATVQEQQETIENLKSSQQKAKRVASINDIENDEKILLMQNRPNPFRTETEIRCVLPETVKNAFICIYDLNGRQQKRIDITTRGEVSVMVSANSLQPGMYIYSLIVDGNEADTKRMILTE